MGETSKQVRVDNWGIFFLSRLQSFFNKTDFCDLTLQFDGNVQLKVHRLVMNACTEYFQALEETCGTVDDILIMPPDMQADVILPIVNFMYSGMLEFQLSSYDKLYRTAEQMNITVLLRLLDAQKQPQQVSKSVVSKVPPTYNLQGKKITPKVEKSLPATLPGRKLPVWKRKTIPQPSTVSPATSYITNRRVQNNDNSNSSYDNQPRPTRFEWPEDDLQSFNMLDTSSTSFDTITYTSKPLLTQEDELRASTSFDDIRYLPNNNKTKTTYNNENVDMEDLKSYVKEQKIRSDFVEQEDDVDNDLDADPDYYPDANYKRKAMRVEEASNKKSRLNEKENKGARINITSSDKSDVDHSKIISEVLKKYPHLVKNNKNIRLKILPKNKTPPADTTKVSIKSPKVKVQVKKPAHVSKDAKDGPWVCKKCSVEGEQIEFVLYYLYRRHMTDVHQETFDILMCKHCGHKSARPNLLVYHQYIRHGIKPPTSFKFPKCEQCPYVAMNEAFLNKHKLIHSKFNLQCSECKVGFNNEQSLKSHIQITSHTGKLGRNSYDCQYCTRIYQTGQNLFTHIRMAHKEEARRDGMVTISESEHEEDYSEEEERVTVLSNVKIPAKTTTEPINNVATGLASSLGLVDIVVLDENQQYILHSNEQPATQEYILPELSNTQFVQNSNQVISSDHNVLTQQMLSSSDIGSTDELVMVLTDHDYNDGNNEILANDNSNIVVLYSHPVDGQENQYITSQGNIMLNSETGMLEIRNAGDGAGAVESIEMIQREIASHVSGEKGDLQVVAPVEETTADISGDIAVQDVTDGFAREGEDVVAAMVEQEVPMETDETCVASTAPQETSEVVGDYEKQPIQTDDHPEIIEQILDDKPETGLDTDQKTELQDTPSTPTVVESEELAPETEMLPPPDVEPEVQTVVAPVEAAETSFEPEPMEIDEGTNQNETVDEVDANNQITEHLKTVEEVTTVVVEEEIPSPPIEEIPTEEEIPLPPVEETAIIEEIPPPTEEVPVPPIETPVQPITEKKESTIVKVDDIDAKLMEMMGESSEDSTPVPIEPESVQSTNEDLVEDNSKQSSALEEVVEENNSVAEESNSVAEENNSVAEENNSMTEETEENNSMSTTENSMDKADEVTATSPDSEQVKATKNSILDDWEDTDSQQSEQSKSNTVNKLITDWDDD